MKPNTDKKKANVPYTDNVEFINHVLEKVDLLIRLRVNAFRRSSQKLREISVDPTLYVSHREVDFLLTPPGVPADYKGVPADDKGVPVDVLSHDGQLRQEIADLQREIDTRVAASGKAGVFLALPQLAYLFNLSPFETDVMAICLAPELRRKYDKIFVYLQDDIARKKPSIDLVLDILCETETDKWRARAVFSHHAPLFRAGLLQVIDDPQSPSASSGLARFLKPDPRILNFILGNNHIDNRLTGTGNDIAKLYVPPFSLEDVLVAPEIKDRVMNVIRRHLELPPQQKKKPVLHFHGPRGVGKHELALGICSQLNCFLLHVDAELLLANEAGAGPLLGAAFREVLLSQAVVYIDKFDALLSGDIRSKALLTLISQLAADYGWVVLAGEKSWSPDGLFQTALFQSIPLPVPPVQLRQQVWEHALGDKQVNPRDKTRWAAELARQFQLTPGRIRDAVEFAHYHHVSGDGNKQDEMTLDHLYNACRKQSNQKLTQLALKIEPKYRWTDIVLSNEKIDLLKEVCSHVKYRFRVFDQWGFDKKLSHGKGLSVLFSGPPGTGKTMAAEVLARELQLDLYKIDLSGVVSKYIGETEKNLAGIFKEAETSNAILFFDEADALFGKRTEVSDAHDRYANIETSFLLQKMEEYEGVVVLATNFRRNMDEAFVRRIRFIVEFPFPDEESRFRIWKSHFPAEAPVSPGIDYEFLAKKVQVAGGNIRNIVLNAAFIAARNGGTIEMNHILSGVKREFEKIGKLWPHGVGTLEERRI